MLTLIALAQGEAPAANYEPALKPGYEEYATRLYATRIQGTEAAASNPSHFVVVNTVAGTFETLDLTKSLGEKPSGIESVTVVMPGAETRYGIDGRCLSQPAAGLNIVRRADGTVVKEIVR